MKLLLDIGNSRVKWALAGDAGLQTMRAAVYPAAEFETWCDQYLGGLPPPDAVRVANVAGAAIGTALTNWCRRHWQLVPAFAATAREADGLRNAYDNVSEMGVDRWLGLVAARRLRDGAVCVISCGTALTLDAALADGEHLGGLIAPGPALMQSALNRAAPGAGTREPLALQLELGRSTRTGVAAGSGGAVAALIDNTIERLAQRHGRGWHCLVTGGAAEAVVPLCRSRLEPVPDLVLRGLAHADDLER